MNDFGAALQVERNRAGLSQHRLAGLADSTQRHISFLETGRSRPTREMILRLCEVLQLPPGSRGVLFEAAGFISPYRTRALDDSAVQEALVTVEQFVLCNWPYPAFAMNETWDILLANPKGATMFGSTPKLIKDNPPNMFDLILGAQFRTRVANWPEVSAGLYARMHTHAISHPEFKHLLDNAIAEGIISSNLDTLAQKREIPVLLPMEFEFEDGSRHRITSLSARFTSAHDQTLSGIEIELLVPLDAQTHTGMLAQAGE